MTVYDVGRNKMSSRKWFDINEGIKNCDLYITSILSRLVTKLCVADMLRNGLALVFISSLNRNTCSDRIVQSENN